MNKWEMKEKEAVNMHLAPLFLMPHAKSICYLNIALDQHM